MTTEPTAPAVLRQRNVPGAMRALGLEDLAVDPLVRGRFNYGDVFTAAPGAAADSSPEQWARAAMEGASATGRFLAWRLLLRLRLEPHPWRPSTAARGAPHYVAGWKIVDRGDNWIRLEARSRFLTANIVFQVDDARVSFATFVRHHRLGALVWTPLSAIHRSVAPDFLGAAVRRMERTWVRLSGECEQ